jgi:4-hydroxybenzoate polyprenyltransferase
VAVGAAALLGGVLLAAGVLSALLASPTAGLVAGLTAASILLYDAWGKRQRIVGPFNMGLCRGLNFLLGMAAVPAVLGSVWFLAVIPLFYIAGVTALSRGEVHGGSRGPAAFALISLSLVSIALLVLTLNSRDPWPGTVLAAVLVLRVMPAFWAAYRSPAPATIRRAVRAGVLSLVLLNAAIGVTFASAQYGLVILATGAAAWALARIFAVT